MAQAVDARSNLQPNSELGITVMEDQESDVQREAEEVGCFGLVGGRAKHLYTQAWFYADRCTKEDGPFICPDCATDAVVRKCAEKRDHFAHNARLSPVIGPEEGELHSQCKDEIVQLLLERFPDGNWEKERTITEHKRKNFPELRPDLSGRIGHIPVAIEVQASTLTIAKIVRRAMAYTKRGISLLWLVPLREPLGELPFRPRLYERYLHSIYYGRTYYWWAGQGLVVKPVHYGPEIRHIEFRYGCDKDGNDYQGGGYDKPYRIIKKPMYGRDINIADDFNPSLRDEFTPNNERKAVPICHIWRDNLEAWWKSKPVNISLVDNLWTRV